MCEGIACFSNNKKAFHGKGTNSHSTAASNLKISEDHYLKSEYHWWDKQLVVDHYDNDGLKILKNNGVDVDIATKVVNEYVRKQFKTQVQIAKWLKDVPQERGRLMKPKYATLAKKVNPKLIIYQKKIANDHSQQNVPQHVEPCS